MRLARFLSQRRNVERIVAAWEEFASSLLPAAAGMDGRGLRDHAEEILAAIVRDLDTAQSRRAQTDKSLGRAQRPLDAPDTAAQTHAILRARVGFNVNQLVAEYRALRASALRLWMDDEPLDASSVEDLMRFNEAIDQAIAESVGHVHLQVERARNLLLGMLGHDMRNPLGSILSTSAFLAALNAGEQVSAAAARLIRSGASIQALLDDLVDFNRTRLGLGIRIVAQPLDFAAAVADEVDQWRGTHPDRAFEVRSSGDCHGCWDRRRLQQALRNLLSNAVKYGAEGTPVRVRLRGDGDDLLVEVTNTGPPVDSVTLDRICDPLIRCVGTADEQRPDSLGLGLYIVREITAAHGGRLQVHAEGGETTFVLVLPRGRPAD